MHDLSTIFKQKYLLTLHIDIIIIYVITLFAIKRLKDTSFIHL